MKDEEIKLKLNEIFKLVIGKELNLNEVKDSDKLVDDLGLTSINILYMVIAVEEVFQITFENVGMNDFKTVADVISYIKKSL